MDDDRNDETQPVRPAGATPAPTPEPAPAPTPSADPSTASGGRGFRERLRRLRSSDRDRTFGVAALIASALAGVIVGGAGLAAVHAVTSDGPGDRGGWVQRHDERHDDRRGPGDDGMRGGPRGGLPGQLPPTTAPEEDEGSAS